MLHLCNLMIESPATTYLGNWPTV